MEFDAAVIFLRKQIEAALVGHMDRLAVGAPPTLVAAMRYSLLGGGKRLRPLLTLAACEAAGAPATFALNAACAIEMIHTYSLIHDDLPAMDDDDFRRGRPTLHKKFGEALAILAGDALLTEAFGLLAAHSSAALAVAELSRAAGAAGMVGGQVLDIEATGHKVSLEELTALHRGKTGALLAAAIRVGAKIGDANEADVAKFARFGEALGLAFQIIDDVLDVTADLATLGKDPGSDRAAGKTTFVDLLGVEGARAHAQTVMAEGLAALESFGPRANLLRSIAKFSIGRQS